jgi:predicted O-methyltransferase YrrM
MAVSFETAVLLRVFCDQLRPRRLLDLGSGFSSYVLRSYAAENAECCVWSVDDSLRWLDRTREFLQRNGLCSDGLMHWDEFTNKGEKDFDLIFHDLGSMRIRAETLPAILPLRRAANGVVVLDDVNRRTYRNLAEASASGLGLGSFDLKAWTLDSFGRYSLAISDSCMTT